MKTKIKNLFFSVLCVCCLIPVILFVSGLVTYNRSGGFSTMAVILGPFVGLDDMVNGGTDPDKPNEWSSSTGVIRDTPYSDGSLRSYKSLYVVNDKFNTSYGGWKHASFIKFLLIERTDGRLIYDDDGVLDTCWWTNEGFTTSDEIVDYSADLYVRTQIMPFNYNGFLGTVLNAKYESGADILITWDRGEDPEATIYSEIKDANANDMGSGNYRNNGVNPGPNYYKLCDMNYHDSPYVTVSVSGTGYWENGWWGGSYDYTKVNAFISGFMPRADRNWNNSLSVNSNIGKSTYKGQTAYYSPKNYVVTATNLNNYVKIDEIKATSKSGTSVAPFKDGHRITISGEGYTLVEIENGAENVYTPYYCFVDTVLPDVSYTYHNTNALTNRKVGNITTNSLGAKQQTIYEGVFRDQVQVNFTYNEDKEAPESATYTLNDKIYELKNGTWLSEEGNYTVVVTDLAGNKTTSTFTIDKSNPNYNLERLQNDKTYKITKWYLADIPLDYSCKGTYSFATYESALHFAKTAEFQTNATSYTLNNVDDFIYTNLLAKNEKVKVGDYWYYKSIDNPDLFVYYFDYNSLDKVVEHYAKEFVSNEQYYKLNSIYSNNYGNIIDSSVIDNTISFNGTDGYIVNNFTFNHFDNNDTYKIYYDFQEDDVENFIEFKYGTPFKSQASSHGLYKIKEVDFSGHETYYFVYLDLNAPMLDIECKIYGKDKTISQTISVADIPNNNELIFYYEKFKITNIIEDDDWWILEVKNANGNIIRYTKLDTLPNFEELGSGEYSITIADRNNNSFTFKVVLLGKAPEVTFNTINANTQLKTTIILGENFNSILDLKIYRNDICLNSENGYDEYPNNEDNSLIFINVNTLEYVFNKGGIYVVEITDTFGRILEYSYKFEKDLPTGILIGVEHNGKTKNDVKFIYDNTKYIVVVNKDNENFNPESSSEENLTTLLFNPIEDSNINYKIQLIDKTDTENYNIYNFTIKTIRPIIYLFGVEPNGKTSGTVYATWDNSDEEQYTAIYTLNGNSTEYKKGQNLGIDGNYTIVLQDELGNEANVSFEIDKSIDFVIKDINENIYKIEEIKYINFDIKLVNNEPLKIEILKDNTLMDYEFGLMLSSEGYYEVRISDEFNNSIYFDFNIDKTPPKATLYGVENFGKTNKSAWIVSTETGLNCWYVRNETQQEIYSIGKEIILNGKYVVYISDLAKNYTTFEFEIDKEIAYDINVYRGGISNGNVRIIAYEKLQIIMYKDDKLFDYSFEQILNKEGEYSFTIIDELGNYTSSFFNIITKKKQNLNHILQEDIEVVEILKNNENYEYEILDNNLYLYDEGSYFVKVVDNKISKEFSFEITLDTTPPTLELVGVENGGTTKNVVVMKNVSENPYTLTITVDGANFEYKLGDKIEKSGRFIVDLYDEAGNKTTYTFERIYTFNGASIAVLAGLGALVVVLIILLIKSRHNHYKEEIIEEEIEENIIEDDFNDENTENPENE